MEDMRQLNEMGLVDDDFYESLQKEAIQAEREGFIKEFIQEKAGHVPQGLGTAGNNKSKPNKEKRKERRKRQKQARRMQRV